MAFDFIDHQLVIETSDGVRARAPLAPRRWPSSTATSRHAGGDGPAGADLVDAGRDSGADPVRAGHRCIIPTIRSTRTGSGGSSCRSTGCSTRSERGSSASAARCTSSGAASIWRSPASRAGRRRRAKAGVHARSVSHEVISHGFWPGSGRRARAGVLHLCGSGARRHQDGARRARRRYYHPELGEFILPYEAVRGVAADARPSPPSSTAPTRGRGAKRTR